MEHIRAYLLSVTAVSLIAVLCLRMIDLPKVKAVLRFITGILVLLVAGSALVSISPEQIEKFASEMSLEFELSQEDLRQEVRNELAIHVQNTAENYIESKATDLGATIQARVTVSEDQYPIPVAVTIIGTLTPQQKNLLQQYLTQSLGISMERQVWK